MLEHIWGEDLSLFLGIRTLSGEYAALLRKRALSMLRLAERLLAEGEYDLSVLNAEYAAQLYVKQLLYRLSGEEYRGHSLRALMGALASLLEEKGFGQESRELVEFIRGQRRLLAELEEGHVRAVYGVYEYSKRQAETLLEAAKRVIEVLASIEEKVFGR